MLDRETKRCIRAVLLQVHPDKFMSFPEACAQNNESLLHLNNFLEAYVEGRGPARSTQLKFWTISGDDEGGDDGAGIASVKVELSGRRSLFELFRAFGVEHSGAGIEGAGEDLDFLEYMQAKVSEAVAISERFRALSGTATRLREEISERYRFEDLRFQDVVRTSCSNAVWQVGALKTLSAALESLDDGSQQTFANQRIVLHRDRKKGFAAVQGREIHLVVNRTLKSQLRKTDKDLLSALSKLNSYWRGRITTLVPAAQSLLRVKSVVGDFVYSGDGATTSSVEDAVLWAGKILRARDAFDFALGGEETFHFSVLVHSDPSLGCIEVGGTMVQVRYDCPPGALVAWLSSPEAKAVNDRVEKIAQSRREEAMELTRVRRALKARQVIRVSSEDDAAWKGACERLVENSEYILDNVDMKGIFLAIDDQYEVWDTGAVSIPHDFTLEALVKNLRKALPPPEQESPQHPALPTPPARKGQAQKVRRRQVKGAAHGRPALSRGRRILPRTL